MKNCVIENKMNQAAGVWLPLTQFSLVQRKGGKTFLRAETKCGCVCLCVCVSCARTSSPSLPLRYPPSCSLLPPSAPLSPLCRRPDLRLCPARHPHTDPADTNGEGGEKKNKIAGTRRERKREKTFCWEKKNCRVALQHLTHSPIYHHFFVVVTTNSCLNKKKNKLYLHGKM